MNHLNNYSNSDSSTAAGLSQDVIHDYSHYLSIKSLSVEKAKNNS